MQDLNAATLDDVKAFFKKWYGPNNAVLALSGDITVAEARDLVTKYYGDIPSGPALTQSREYVAKRTGSRRDTMQAAIASHQLIKTWNAPGWAASDAQLLRLAAAVLSEGQNSRLHKRLVRDLQLASEVSADMNLQELGSQFSISATARPGVTLSQLEEAINGVLAEFLRSGPTAEELNRLKFARYASYVRGLTSTMAKAQMLAEGEVWARTPDFYRTRQAVTNGATPSSVVDVARKWLADGAYVLEIEALPRRSTTGKSVDRTAQPLIGPMPPFVLPPLQRATLSNGVTVMLAERRDVPTVSVSMLFDVGSNPDRNPASVGLNNLGLTTFGTATRNALEIESLSQDLSTSLSWQSDQELTRFSMNSLKINLDQSLDLYADVLLNPTFPKDEWDRHLKNFEAAFEDNKLTPAGKAWMVRNKMIYGVEHPYGAVYTPAVARTRKVEDFRSFHRKWIRPDLATILVVGDTTLSEIIPMFEQRLKGWKAVGPKPLKAPLPAPGRAAGPRVLLFDQPGAESSLVSLAQTGPARNAEDYDLLSVVDTVVGGGFLSRLNLNLRENKGWSYGARSELAERALIGLVEVGAAVQTDKTAPAMLEIFRELKEVASSRPPSAAEVQSAKNTMLLGMASTLQDPSGAAKLYRQIHQYGLSDDYYNRYTKKIQSFTIEQVQAAARRLYHPSEFTWFVVGDLSKIEKDVRALNFGEVMVYDANGNRVR
jgi:zinc protease